MDPYAAKGQKTSLAGSIGYPPNLTSLFYGNLILKCLIAASASMGDAASVYQPKYEFARTPPKSHGWLND